MATITEERKATFEDLFEGMGQKELAPDVVPDEVPLTDKERGARAARDRLAERMEADANDIQVIMEDIGKKLMEGGVIVDIDVHRWTGMVRLQPEDLGLKKANSKAIRLGDKLLMPPTFYKSASSLTTQLRANLDRYSFHTVYGRWVPATAYRKWKRRHDQLAKEFEGIGEILATHRDDVIAGGTGTWGELRRLYAEHARAAWCRLNRLPVDSFHLEQCPAWFVEEYCNAIFNHMPAAEEIRDSFYVEAHISYIPLPSMLEEDRARSDRVWEKATEEREADRRRLEAQEAMEADVRNHYVSRKREEIDSFLTSLASEVYTRVYDVSSRALATMAKNQGQILEPTLRQLRSLIEWGENMNIANDEELATALNNLQGMVNRSAGARSADDVREQLQAMGTVARSVLVDLNVKPSVEDTKLSLTARDAVLGIGPRLSRAEVAKARETLGTNEIEDLPIVRARRGKKVKAFQEIPQL